MNFSHTLSESCIYCEHCSKEILGKPWMSYRCPKDDEKHICSYICYRRNPFLNWEQVINKQDFNTLIPIVSETTRKSFHYLKRDDLLQMSDSEISEYYERLDEERMINPIATEVHETQEYEDILTQAIEGESSDNEDDY